ncbi:MAG: 4'-phosphopantetheinyl transferase superfamily protein [Planctomycetota bacterium]
MDSQDLKEPPLAWISELPPDALDRLSAAERARQEEFPAEKRRQDWLLGRVAAKQAVRDALVRAGAPAPGWDEFEVLSAPCGAPRVVGLPAVGLAAAPVVSLTHGHGHAAAWALLGAGLPGVDLERIKPRPAGTLRFYLHEPEREWLAALAPSEGERAGPRDVAAVVLWALKEAAFKTIQPPRGTGLLDVVVRAAPNLLAPTGTAELGFRERGLERARELGVTGLRAGWRAVGEDLVVAWVEAEGGALPA